ncbi:MAG: hypothetical protein B0D92_01915 [Spirochaeta sp. LUC14_002_19_P3]|nr:MAG: hypothetical protein B0D92_01915 [Spirochaeta sp. LUC14_002_19_P3]
MNKHAGNRKVRTVFGRETHFTGTLKFKESLQINGRFDGIINSSGFLMVETGAVVNADIKTDTLVVAGTIKGDVYAAERLELLHGGKIIGNIRCLYLIAADSTSIQGRCDMIKDAADIDVFSLPLDQLKKSVNRVD